jgi:hypothetical protein
VTVEKRLLLQDIIYVIEKKAVAVNNTKTIKLKHLSIECDELGNDEVIIGSIIFTTT